MIIEQKINGVLIYQLSYVEKILNCINMDKAYPLSTLMVVQFLDPKKDPLCPKEDDREILSLKVSYLNAILLYYIQLNVPNQTLHSLLTSQQDLAKHQHNNIGMASNISFDIFVECWTWGYFIEVN